MHLFNRFRRGARRSSTPARFDDVFYRRLERLTLLAERTLRGRPGGEHLSTRTLPSAEFTQHRPYVAGDDPRYVDWAVYARSDEHFVRLGETPQDVRVHLLVDRSASMAWGWPRTKLDAACQVAAVLGHIALAAGDVVRVVPVAQRLGPGFGPASGKARSQALLRFLAALQPARGTALAASLSDYAAARHGHGGLLVLLSDLWTLEAEALDGLLRRGRPPPWQGLVLQMLDPSETTPQPVGETELEDLETGLRVMLRLDPATIAAYQAHLEAWYTDLATTCSRHGATILRLDSTWGLDTVVVPFLTARRVLG